MADIPHAAAAGFSAAAEVYERARPGYPKKAVAWLAERLGIGPNREVVDLAAGTGKLTRQLVQFGARLIAVEPLEAMRAQFERAVPGVEVLAGTAEAIPLRDGSVDAVTCAQAFHWFQPERALPEIRRVLRPGGGLGLIWNLRDKQDPLQVRIDEILEPYRRGAYPGAEKRWQQALELSPLFGPLEQVTFAHRQEVTLPELLERVASTSFVAAMPEEERSVVLDAVRAAAAELPEEAIPVPYRTDVFVTNTM